MLTAEGVTVRFGGQVALQDVDLRAPDGQITGLIGPNGAGKTTMFNIISGLGTPSRGRVRLDGVDITPLPPFRRARLGLARTFQQLQLFGTLTVRENLELAAGARHDGDERPSAVATRLLRFLGIEHLAEVHAHNVPTGQARLVELGRALATRPSLLLLDEPASGQDQVETEHFAAVLEDLAAEGISILLVEHDMSLVMRVCAEITVLDFGRTVATGSPEEIRTDPAVLAAYLGTGWEGP
jgi:branched-chain amino acid transport system ATP-binding protein